MLIKPRIATTLLMVFLVFLASAVITVPAFADDGQPPITPEAINTIEPSADTTSIDASSPTPEPDSTQITEATPDVQVFEESPVATEKLLANIPENTDVVLLNQNGESVPLVTQEAASIIVTGDPIWCPAGVAIPVAGVNGCTDPGLANVNYDPTSLGSLLSYLANNQPNVDGVIWIEAGYDKTKDIAPITFNGATLTTMANFKLTLKGGWLGCPLGVCVGTIDTNSPSVFDDAISIINWKNDVTLSDIVVDTSTASYGVEVSTTKSINLNRVKSINNVGPGNGALLDNTSSTTANAVTVSNSKFSDNDGFGLTVYSKGNITLASLFIENNGFGALSQHGAVIDNSASTTAASITITGSTFAGNKLDGLQLISKGLVTLANINTNTNGSIGADIDNSNANTPLNVVMTGDNTFNTNGGYGLYVKSKGAITLNNVLANKNSNMGAYLTNDFTGAAGAITLTGFNVFTENIDNGLFITSRGAIVINNITASSNGQSGANIQNTMAGIVTPQPVTLAGTNRFEDNNGSWGLVIKSNGLITTNNINANINKFLGVEIDNSTGVNAGVSMTGTNSFNANGTIGLLVSSKGSLSLANVNANGNTFEGATLSNYNSSAPMNITLSGTNSFSNNGSDGLLVDTKGIVTISNITASNNTGNGAGLDNHVHGNPSSLKGITLTGTNIFSNNKNNGLVVNSYGVVTLANITASSNGDSSGENGVNITNGYVGTTITPVAVTLTGVNFFNSNFSSGLSVASLGAITVNNVSANDNHNGYGVTLDNKNAASSAVSVIGAPSLNHNKLTGLYVQSKGTITISNVNAGQSITEYGAQLDNTFSTTQSGIVVSGINTFNSNYNTGLYIRSKGTVSINSVTANSNGLTSSGYGADISNLSASPVAKTISITGVNKFNDNKSGGLLVNAKGAISVSSVTASNNVNGEGVSLNNISGSYAVTVAGSNTFNNNLNDGLLINSLGVVTLSNITASYNGALLGNGRGVTVINDLAGSLGSVAISGSNVFNNNKNTGLYIVSRGTISISGVTASSNGNAILEYGVYLDNTNAVTNKSIVVGGVNTFNLNYDGGLFVNTKGTVTSPATATLNADLNSNGVGIYISNTLAGTSPQVVSLLGKINVSSSSQEGLYVKSIGAITVNNIKATGNNISGLGAGGVVLKNDISGVLPSVPPGVYIGGTNSFTGNEIYGLQILTSGVISVANITAMDNTGDGVHLENNHEKNNTSKALGVTVSGVNKITGNGFDGLFVDSAGLVTLSNITSQNNGGNGAFVNTESLGPTLPQSVTLLGTNNFSGNGDDGLNISAYGSVNISGITAKSNGGYGLKVVNNSGYMPANVTISGINTFTGNQTGGLYVISIGSITVSSLTATDTTNGTGAYLHNDWSYTIPVTLVIKQSVGTITLSGLNTFTGNYVTGLDVGSFGAITLNSVNASNNGHLAIGYGVKLTNKLSTATIAPKVTLTGNNIFNGNKQNGLDVNSRGAITVSNLIANNNNDYGAYFDNDTGGSAGITITGFSTTLSNTTSGLVTRSSGAINLTKVTADNNGNNGLFIITSSTAVVTCGSFINNTGFGLQVTLASTLTLKGVITAGNAGGDTSITGVLPSSVIIVRACPLP
ncbi:MAG: right-handed parallel beta-helix repeat-containing protein [Anaerolineales bacterium]